MPPNELRIDAAEGVYAKRNGLCAAASVRVELSRIWKKKPGVSGENILRTQCPPIKDDLESILHEKRNPVKEKRKGTTKTKEIKGNAKWAGAKEAPARRGIKEVKKAF